MKVNNHQATALVIVLIGPPGAGKGTQCEQLAATLLLPHISTGHLLREYAEGRSAAGEQVKSFIDAGNLVPDSLVRDVLEERQESRTATADSCWMDFLAPAPKQRCCRQLCSRGGTRSTYMYSG